MKQATIEEKRGWLTANEAALRLGVDPSRVRQLVLHDLERSEEYRVFPTARKATASEAKEFLAAGRVNRVPYDGIWLIDASDIARRLEKQGKGLIGRSPNWQTYYAGCAWFRGISTPAEEALLWACDGQKACVTVMLIEPLRRYYERCVPVEVMSNEGWDVVEPRTYTELLHDAYLHRAYGTIAFLMAPFHPGIGIAKVISQVELKQSSRQRKTRSSGPFSPHA